MALWLFGSAKRMQNSGKLAKDALTRLERNAIFLLWKSGYTVSEMAAVLQVTRYKIQKYVASFGGK
jgi:hypothetical protein